MLESQALKAFQAGRHEEAAAGFEAARRAYCESGQRGKAAKMANNLSVTLLLGGNARRAMEAANGTPQVFHELGDSLHEAQAWGNLASAQEGCGDLQSAEASYHRAIDLFASLGDDENRAICLRSLFRLQLRRGRPIEASLTMQSALQARPGGARLVSRLLGWLRRERPQ